MDPERWQRVEALVEAALLHTGTERTEFVRASCDGDDNLEREIYELISAHQQVDRFMEQPAYALSDAEELAGDSAASEHGTLADKLVDGGLAPGDRVGRYAIEKLLGSGGMGHVYLAARADREFQRHVAIKVLSAHHLDRRVVGRFRMERQILANLDHPNIARLLEGGALPDGRPYLIMEYIQGVPLCRYCDQRNLDVPGRIELLRRICSAVHYAHSNLVLHLDIKPGNILVTDDGTPKLLDFGIAKWLRDDGSESALTVTGYRPLTPSYASPEQLNNQLLSTASDVYSLGLVMYRLLSGALPARESHRPSDARPGATRRLRPSEQRPPAGRLPYSVRQLRGDLDNIAMKAIRPEPDRRYGSAAALAEDLRRHVHREPVRARRDTFAYRANRFITRNWIAVTVVSLIAVTLVGVSIYALTTARRLAAERDRATAARLRAEQISDFMTSLFKSAAPTRVRDQPVTAREILDRAVRKLPRTLRAHPEARADILHTMGLTYRELGHYDRSAELLTQALRIREELFGDRDPAVAKTLEELAGTYQVSNRLADALPLRVRILALRRRLLGPRHFDLLSSMYDLGSLYYMQGDYQRARTLFLEAIALAQSGDVEHAPLPAGKRTHQLRIAPTQMALAHLYKGLAVLEWKVGNLARAEELLVQSQERFERFMGAEHVDTALVHGDLGALLSERGDVQRAKVALKRALHILEKARGREHPWFARVLYHHGALLQKTGELDAAEQALAESFTVLRARLDGPHPHLRECGQALMELYAAQGRESERRAVADNLD